MKSEMMKAIFAAGCFWGVQDAFDMLDKGLTTTVGYTGGHTKHPTYEQVCRHNTGHTEAVMVEFNPEKITYEELLDAFWNMHDPTQHYRQGPDIGDQYRSAIFYTTPEQEKEALESRDELAASGEYDNPITTEITAATEFYPAEDYHQKYSQKIGQSSCHIIKH